MWRTYQSQFVLQVTFYTEFNPVLGPLWSIAATYKRNKKRFSQNLQLLTPIAKPLWAGKILTLPGTCPPPPTYCQWGIKKCVNDERECVSNTNRDAETLSNQSGGSEKFCKYLQSPLGTCIFYLLGTFFTCKIDKNTLITTDLVNILQHVYYTTMLFRVIAVLLYFSSW